MRERESGNLSRGQNKNIGYLPYIQKSRVCGSRPSSERTSMLSGGWGKRTYRRASARPYRPCRLLGVRKKISERTSMLSVRWGKRTYRWAAVRPCPARAAFWASVNTAEPYIGSFFMAPGFPLRFCPSKNARESL